MYHEIYGKYYQIIFELLNSKPQTEKEINDYIRENGYEESFLYLNAEKLVNDYHLFEKRGNLYYPKTINKIPQVLTNEQKSWIVTMLTDEKSKLFLNNKAINSYKEKLNCNALYEYEDYQYLFQDKDIDIITPKFIGLFKAIQKTIIEKMNLQLTFLSSHKNYTHKLVAPVKIEYSQQDEKIRLMAVEYRNSKPQRMIRIRLSSVIGYRVVNRKEEIDFEYFQKQELLKDPLMIEVYPELNGIERVFIELSNYKREAIFDKERNLSVMKIYYEKVDEMDLVLKILSFGKVVKIISNGFIKEEVLRRLLKQKEYMKRRIS